jgi:uncharacterized membrane protein YkgB
MPTEVGCKTILICLFPFRPIQIRIVNPRQAGGLPDATIPEEKIVSDISVHTAPAYPSLQARAAFPVDLVDRYGRAVTTTGLYASLVVVYAWFGGMKFTAYEAQGLTGLVGNSPFLSWAYFLFSERLFSGLLGILELSIGALIAARLVSPKYSLVGGLLSAGLFVTTLSFMVTTPGVFEPEMGFPAISVAPGQFLLKDVGLLAVSLWIAVDSFAALRSARA